MRCLICKSVTLVAPVTCSAFLVSCRPLACAQVTLAPDGSTIQPSAVGPPDVVTLPDVPRCHTSIVPLRNLFTMPPGSPMVMVEPEAVTVDPPLDANVRAPERPLRVVPTWSTIVHLLAVLHSSAT